MKKVLVTGATGFIGNYVIRELLDKGYRIIATSATEEKAKLMEWYDKVKYIPFDLKEISPGADYFKVFDQPDILIHLAWEGLPNYKSAFHVEENLPRHYEILKNLIHSGLKDISITGTCLEYGMQEGCLTEEMPPFPSNPYAVAKNSLRLSLTELAKTEQFELKWIRLFYVYGKGQNPNSLLSQLQSALDRGDEVFNMSAGDQLRDYLPVEKVAEYIMKIACQHEETGIINCCSGVPISVRNVVLNYLKERNKEIALNPGHYPYSDIEPKNFWGDITKLKRILANSQLSLEKDKK